MPPENGQLLNRILRLVIFGLTVVLPFTCSAQGVFIYDQESAVEGTGGNLSVIQGLEPVGQSFTPTLSSVGFIRLALGDGNLGNGLGATMYLTLRSGSITGPVLSSTEPVTMANGYGGYTDFLFASPVEVTPGTTYFFDVNVQSGDIWRLMAYSYGYQGGDSIFQGTTFGNQDLWFREGIVAVPEPSTWALLVFGYGGLLLARRRFN